MTSPFDILRDEARKVIRKRRSGSSLSLDDSRLQTIPQDISLVTIRDNLISDEGSEALDTLEGLVIAEACLRGRRRTPLEIDDKTAASELYGWISTFILPGYEFVRGSDYEQGKDEFVLLRYETPLSHSEEVERARDSSTMAIRILLHLNAIAPIGGHANPQAVIVSLAAFTDKRDPWVTVKAFEMATRLLDGYAEDMTLASGQYGPIIRAILKENIRPLFAKSKNPAITSQGRKSIRPVRVGYESSVLDGETKPWKFRHVYIVSVFQWVLQHLDAALAEDNWPLIIPPLLTIVDDDLIEYKARGCELVVLLLRVTPPSMLSRTGVGEVFDDAIMPYLQYLPSLTPENQSIRLLDTAYPALITLTHSRFFGHSNVNARRRSLDKIVRQGILKGYYHANEHVKITELLVLQIPMLVDDMGIWSVTHLKDLIPLLSEILAAPFGTAYPPLLLAAVKAIQAILVNCWPRIAIYRGEILRGLTTCWCRLLEDGSEGLDSVSAAIKDAIKLLTAAFGNAVDAKADYGSLVDSDERLSFLFT
ncbi:MAG: hypothetical protein M1830_010096 [Pleopsidium flavum]|nr:MAG: hypothetical protein M1830_010096 [Pleopsidium flavum]